MVTESTNRRMKKYISIVHGLCLYPDIWPVPQNAQCILHKKHQGGKISHTEQRLSVMGHGYKWTTDNGCNGYNDTIKHKIMYERAISCIWMKQYHFMRCLVRLSMNIGA